MTYHSALLSPMTWVRAFTHIFGHADWEHFISNMSYILLLGPMLEEKYTSKTLTGVIAITAFGTSLVNYVFFPSVALCGASGVVFAFILLSSFTGFKDGEIPITFILVAVFFIGQQIWDGITVQDNISNMAHIVGGMIPAVEIMKIVPAIQNMIRDSKNYQIDNVIQTSGELGMVSMDQYILKLYRKGEISEETALLSAINPEQLKRKLSR